jgi:hypothetical protein
VLGTTPYSFAASPWSVVDTFKILNVVLAIIAFPMSIRAMYKGQGWTGLLAYSAAIIDLLTVPFIT